LQPILVGVNEENRIIQHVLARYNVLIIVNLMPVPQPIFSEVLLQLAVREQELIADPTQKMVRAAFAQRPQRLQTQLQQATSASAGLASAIFPPVCLGWQPVLR